MQLWGKRAEPFAPDPGRRGVGARGDPGTGCRGAGRCAGTTRSHALGKFPGRSQPAGFLAGIQRRAPCARVPRAGSAPRTGTPPKSKVASPWAPRAQSRGSRAEGRSPPAVPIVWLRPRPDQALTCSPAWRPGWRSSWPATGDPRERGGGRTRPAEPPGSDGDSGSPSSAPASQAPAASIALPAAAAARHCAPGPAPPAWSHAPPAPRALGPAPRPASPGARTPPGNPGTGADRRPPTPPRVASVGHSEARSAGQEPPTFIAIPGRTSGPRYLREPHIKASDPDPRSFAPNKVPIRRRARGP
jgi:hypothetical protein